MDQILFIFDLDQLLPVEGDRIEEDDQESRVNILKSGCLRLLLYNKNQLNKKQRQLPYFGFRFFSSTGFYQSPEQSNANFVELSLDTLGDLETALDDKFRTVIQNAVKESSRNEEYYSNYTNSKGYHYPSDRIKSVLEEVAVLFDWDRPSLQSPIKTGVKVRKGLGNAVFLMTKLPHTQDEMTVFIKDGNKKLSHREISSKLFSKKMRSFFHGGLSVSLHFVDTAQFHDADAPSMPEIQNQLNKCLKDFGGAVIPLEVVAVSDMNLGDKGDVILRSSSDNQCSLPTTAVLRSFLEAAVTEAEEVNEDMIVSFDGVPVKFECSEIHPATGNLVCKGYARKTMLSLKMRYKEEMSVWSGGPEATSVLNYIYLNNRVAVMTASDDMIVLLTANDGARGVVQVLDPSDSNFLACLLKLKRFHVEAPALPARCLTGLEDIDTPVSEVRDESSGQGFWDANALEKWRIPDSASFRFLDLYKEREPARRVQRHNKFSLMQKVREQYVAKDPVFVKTRPKKRDTIPDSDNRPNVEAVESLGGWRRVELKKHLSEMSTGSSASRSSRSSGVGMSSTGSFLRHNSRGSLGAENSEKEVSSDKKASKAGEMLSMFLREVDINNQEELNNLLQDHKRSIVEAETENNLEYASFSEACVSAVLQHLDSSGVAKTSLEELISEHLLLDVQSVSRRYSSQLNYRISEHKVQVLVRCEVYWLLANKQLAVKFEEAILDHLRQISFHSSPLAMSQFLQDVLLHCYVSSQPDLLCTLYDELDQDRPDELNQLFSPDPKSVQPSSNISHISGTSQNSNPTVQEPKRASRKFLLARPKSFDASLNRQISISAGALKRCNSKGGTAAGDRKLGVLAKKGGVKEKGRGAASKRVSSKKRVISSSLHKSPRKALQLARRNLCFDKSPKKKMTTPVKKSKMTPQKMTPGKSHRVMVPDTPTNKLARRKSDGNTSISDTPDKKIASFLNVTFEQRSQFYTNNRSRNATKYEENETSLISAHQNSLRNTSDASATDGKINIFSHLLPKKRKRDSLEDPELAEPDCEAGPRKRRRQISFSDEVNSVKTTPVKSSVGPSGDCTRTSQQRVHSSFTEMSRVSTTTPRKNSTDDSEDISPNKRVSFNPKHIPATPKRVGFRGKGILKTPSKSSPVNPGTQLSETKRTPSKVASFRFTTPGKSPSRMDIKNSPMRLFNVSAVTPSKDKLEGPSSPIISSSTKMNLSEVVTTTPMKPEVNCPLSPIITSSRKKLLKHNRSLSDPDMHGFTTPELKATTVNVTNIMNEILKDIDDSDDGSSGDELFENDDLAGVPKDAGTPTKVALSAAQCVEFLSPKKSGRRSLHFTADECKDEKVDAPATIQNASQAQSSLSVRNKTKPKKEREILDDQLTNYFSPQSNKRRPRTRIDIQDNLAIVNALQEDFSRKKRKATTLKETDEVVSTSPSQQPPLEKKPRRRLSRVASTYNIQVAEEDVVEKEDQPTNPKKVPKALSSLQDHLSSFYSPVTLGSRRSSVRPKYNETQDEEGIEIKEAKNAENMAVVDVYSYDETDGGRPCAVLFSPARFECTICSEKFRYRKLFKTHEKQCSEGKPSVKIDEKLSNTIKPLRLRETPSDTPTKVDAEDSDSRDPLIDTPSRRSGRSRVPVSYEESMAEFDISTETSPEIKEPACKKKFRLSSPIPGQSRSKFESRPSKYRRDKSPGSSDADYNDTKSSKLCVKTINDSIEMEDIAGIEDSSVSTISTRTPEKYGKYFSIGAVQETPTGDFRIKLNRVTKRKSFTKSASTMKTSTPPTSHNYLMPRVSRSVSKDIGISPQKLAKIINDSPKRNKETGLVGALEATTPGKENTELKAIHNVKTTPRIRIKRVLSKDPLKHHNSDYWTSETVVSPVKQLTSRPARDFSSDEEDGDESPSPLKYGSPGLRGSFSPLTSSSIHKLTTSPLVASQTGRSVGSKLSKKKRINKQLYS